MLNIIRNDITRVTADVIVNSANPEPTFGRGTDFAVYKAAGREELLAERRKIGEIATGDIAVTPAFGLNAKYIIHTVGPVWHGGNSGEFLSLASCYSRSLEKAKELRCESIAFPLISTGVYGFPKDRALRTAIDTISAFLEENDMEITLVVFDSDSFRLSEALTRDIDSFLAQTLTLKEDIDDERAAALRQEFYPGMKDGSEPAVDFCCSVSQSEPAERRRFFRKQGKHERQDISEEKPGPQAADEFVFDNMSSAPAAEKPAHSVLPPADMTVYSSSQGGSLDDILSSTAESFSTGLFRMIDERGLNDVEVYKRANMDRKLFSKIRCTPGYQPKKKTALALAIALKLNIDETLDFLKKAGFTLSESSKVDKVVEYCINKSIYNINDVNIILFRYTNEILP